jgi:hypothetical protein
MSSLNLVPIVGRTANGGTVWYTGRAGAAFVSADRADAFMGYSLEGARNRATILNRGTAFHGIRFVAVAGDLAEVA